MFAGHALGLDHGFDFPAGIPNKKSIHGVPKRRKIIIVSCTVNAVVDGNQPDVLLPQDLHDLTDFEIIAPQVAHIFDDNSFHMPRLDFRHHSRESRAVESGSAYTVVGKMRQVHKAILSGIFLQYLFLVRYAVALTLQLVVAG